MVDGTQVCPCGKRARWRGFCDTCYHAQWKATHVDRFKVYYKTHDDKRRDDLNRILGGKCVCCGEVRYEFLTLDHIKTGDGRREYSRTERHPRRRALRELLAMTPEDLKNQKLYRLLCANCNHSLGHYGRCPHSTLTAPVFRAAAP